MSSTSPAAPEAVKSRNHTVWVWLAATVLTSSAALLTRYCRIPATSIGFWRVAGASVVLAPWWFAVWRADGRPRVLSRGPVLAGLFLGLHFATWAWALQHATIANAMLFVGLQPLMAPFLARPLLGERLNRWEIVACLLACAGMVTILGRQLTCERGQLAGSAMAFLSAGLCACYLVLTRKYRPHQHAMLFTLPVYLVAAGVQAIAGFAIDGGISVGSAGTRLALLGLILFPTVGGHTLAIYLLRHVKSQMVTLSIPAQFVLATTAAVFLFGEKPSAWMIAGAVLVLGAVVLGVHKSGRAAPATGTQALRSPVCPE